MVELRKIIEEICLEIGIKITLISEDFIMILEKNNQIKTVFGCRFPLNNHGIGEVIDDKYGFHELLKYIKVPVAEIVPIFENTNIKTVLDYFYRHNSMVVLKPNDGAMGNDVYKVTDEDDLLSKVEYLKNKNHIVCLSPYYDIKTEYRVIVLNGHIELLYGKRKPIIVGNGKMNIKELLLEFNHDYYSSDENIKELSIDLNNVPKLGEIIEVSFKFNLSGGAQIKDVFDDELIKKLETMALNVCNKLDITFASVDIIETVANELLILEVNSGVGISQFTKLHKDGKVIAKNIYSKAIDMMFDE